MTRFIVVALVAAGCHDIYAPFNANPGDGGRAGQTNGGIGGTKGSDAGISLDLETPTVNGLITAHSGTPSFVSAVIGPDVCANSTVEGCTLRVCPAGDLGESGSVGDVGDISIAGAVSPILLVPDAFGRYQTESSPAPLWNADVELTYAATGGTYAAFSAFVSAPLSVEVLVPLPTPTVDIPRVSDLNLSWTGGREGVVTVTISVAGTSLSCDLPLDADSGTVSHTALGKLPVGDGSFDVEVTTRGSDATGVALTAETPALDSTGRAYPLPAVVH